VGKCVGIFFPVPAVEVFDLYRFCLGVQAVNINVNAVRVRAWSIERLNAASLAKAVFRHTGIERIAGKALLTGK